MPDRVDVTAPLRRRAPRHMNIVPQLSRTGYLCLLPVLGRGEWRLSRSQHRDAFDVVGLGEEVEGIDTQRRVIFVGEIAEVSR